MSSPVAHNRVYQITLPATLPAYWCAVPIDAKNKSAVRHSEIDGSNAGSSLLTAKKKVLSAKNGKYDRLKRLFVDTWMLEWIAISCAVACLSAIYAIVFIFNGQALSHWHSYLSVNTLLSALGTLMKASVMLATAATLGQWKWIYFDHQTQPFKAFGLHDEASRGPFGSAQLLYNLRFGHLASLGCVITVLALFVEPFIQASVVTLERSKELPGAASTPISTFTDPDKPASGMLWTTIGLPENVLDDRLQVAAYAGISARQHAAEIITVSPKCPTGDCTYPFVSSLGMCSRCTNRSSDILFVNSGDRSSQSTLAHYPSVATSPLTLLATNSSNNSSDINLRFGVLNSSFTVPSMDDPKADSLPLGVLDLLMNTWTAPPGMWGLMPSNYSAYRCELSICSRTEQTRVIKGKQQITSSEPFIWTGKWAVGDFPISQGTFTFDSAAHPSREVAVSYIDWETLARFLESLLPGNATEETYRNSSYYSDHTYFSSETTRSIASPYDDLSTGPNSGVIERVSIVDIFDDFATTMSTAMRSSASTFVNGTAIGSEIYIHIRWPYLVLPSLVVGLAIVFLALTIWRSRQRGVPTWKSSVLASVVHANQAVEEKGTAVGTISGLEEWAEERQVSFAFKE